MGYMDGLRVVGWCGVEGEKLYGEGMKGEEGVEERRGDLESDAICNLWRGGGLEGSRAEGLSRGRSAECGDVF